MFMGVAAGSVLSRIGKGEMIWGTAVINFRLLKSKAKYIIGFER